VIARTLWFLPVCAMWFGLQLRYDIWEGFTLGVLLLIANLIGYAEGRLRR
jgi:hypothetical protein